MSRACDTERCTLEICWLSWLQASDGTHGRWCSRSCSKSYGSQNYNAMAEVMEGAAAETLGVATCCASCCSCCCGGSPEETCGLCCAGCSLEALGCAGCCDACCCCGGADDPGCCTLALDTCGLLACCEMLGCVACFSCCFPCCFRQKKDPQVVIAQGPVMYPANFTPEQMAMGPPRMMYPPQPQMMGYPQAQGYQY